MESGVYAAPMARLVKTVLTSTPLLLISYRLPSSLLEKTVPLPSTAGAFTHHSNPTGWSETQVMLPSLLRVQLCVFVFCQRQLICRSGVSDDMKYCSG